MFKWRCKDLSEKGKQNRLEEGAIGNKRDQVGGVINNILEKMTRIGEHFGHEVET